MSDNFYCQKKCTPDDFSIDEWNEAYNYCLENNLSEEETNRIMEGEPCTEQCFDCMAVVGETRIKNRKKKESK